MAETDLTQREYEDRPYDEDMAVVVVANEYDDQSADYEADPDDLRDAEIFDDMLAQQEDDGS